MTIRKLASLIAKREGKRSQARIGDIREILSILSDLMVEDCETAMVLVDNGMKRSRRKPKGKRK